MRSRLARVRDLMAAQELDACVAFSPDNVFYLTNFANFVHERPFVLVVAKTGEPRFVVPKLEIPHVRARAVGELELVEYPEFPAPPATRGRIASARSFRRMRVWPSSPSARFRSTKPFRGRGSEPTSSTMRG